MKVNVVFVKGEGEQRTEQPYESLTEEEKKEQAKKLTRRFMETMGYNVIEKT